MKKRYLAMLPCLVILMLFSWIHCLKLKTDYDELLDSSGLVYEDLKAGLKKENELARRIEEEYQSILEPEDNQNKVVTQDTVNGSLKLNSLSALLLDATNNRILYEKDGYKEMPMASTTKIMTCLIALENAKMDEIVTVSSYAASMPDVQLGIKANEQYFMKDLLYSLMLESHNDVAVAIAEHIGGSVEGFASMMNDKARSLGCEHTNFVTPNGLDAEGHFTTARDLAVIASYAITNEDFIKITNTSAYQFKEIKKGKAFTVSNKNKFLYMMEGAIGVKTGFTSKAGYCFVGAVKRLDRTLVSVVLGCGWPPSKSLKWRDTKALMTYGIEAFQKRDIYPNQVLEPVFVEEGQKKFEPVSLEGYISLLMREDETVRIEYDIPEKIAAPVAKDQIIGYANYYINDEFYTQIPIYTTEDIRRIDYPFCLNKIFEFWRIH